MATDGAATVTSPADELAQLRQENELLRTQRQELLEARQRSDREIEGLQQQLQYLLRRLYGRSSEKLDPKQLVLFNELLEQLAPQTPSETAASSAPPASESAKPKSKGRTRGHHRIPRDLPRQQVIHDLLEDQKICPCCGNTKHVIGREVTEQIDFIPAKITVIQHVQIKYACKDCNDNAAPSGAQVVTAEKPLSPIEKGLAAPGLLAYVIVSKYGDHLPLYRLERIFERHGIEIARSTMCGWAAQCAAVLKPLYDRMVHNVLQSRVIHTDDTPVKVLEPGLGQTRTGRFWNYLGDKEHSSTVFTYTPNRSRDGPMEFLSGWGKDRRVYLQADAFGGYDGIYAGQAGGQVIEVACWAHVRRKFYDARTSDVAASTQALAYIRLLYDVEDEAKKQFESQEAQRPLESQDDTTMQSAESGSAASSAGESQSSDGASPDAAPGGASQRESFASVRLRLRQERAVPRLEQFKAWLQSRQAEHGGSILPKSPIGQAITYALNQWDALCVYTTDGDLAIDNNAAENALRRVAIGRKNWLFCGSDNGGHTAAILFSLIATCQRHNVEPLAYLRDVLTRIPATPISQLDQFLPDRWKLPADPPVVVN